MKTKKALAGLFGLLGSLAAALLRPAALAGFLATESLSTYAKFTSENDEIY